MCEPPQKLLNPHSSVEVRKRKNFTTIKGSRTMTVDKAKKFAADLPFSLEVRKNAISALTHQRFKIGVVATPSPL